MLLIRNLLRSAIVWRPLDKTTGWSNSVYLRGGPEFEKLPECLGGMVERFYDVIFTIEKVNESENCTDDDFEKMGFLLEHIIADIEKEYFSYQEEFVDMTVCPPHSNNRKRYYCRGN